MRHSDHFISSVCNNGHSAHCSALLLLFAFSTIATITQAFSAVSTSTSSHEEAVAVSVFDNVLPTESQDILHKAASKSGLGHKAFTRPLQNDAHSSVIERALDTILTELGDVADRSNQQYVEYWSRQEFRHIEAHADVDEHLAKEADDSIAKGELSLNEAAFRYPQNGHVLYLKIGTDVRGPTCIFPKTSTGGELVQQPEVDENENGQCGSNVDLVVVPAVDGRLLRFPGDSLHAVPRPTDLWFLSFVRGSPVFKPEEKWGRSVILFNTWRGSEDPPKDVLPADTTTAKYMDEIVVHKREQWKDTFVMKKDNKHSNRNEEEDKVCKPNETEEEEEAMSKVKIWLLGNERRRNSQLRTVKMKAKSSVREAMQNPEAVSRVSLKRCS
jgi:hypothetical protein